MGFFDDIFGGAKKIIDSGKDALKDQLSTHVTYEKGQGVTSTSDVSFLPGLLGSNAPKVPAPKIFTSARKMVFGESGQERLNRLQSEAKQTFTPEYAIQAVTKDIESEGGSPLAVGYRNGKFEAKSIDPFATMGFLERSAKNVFSKNVKNDIVDNFKHRTGTSVPAENERAFSNRVSEMVPEADINVEKFSTRNTNELAQKARTLIQEDPVRTQTAIDKIKTGKNLDEDDVAIGSELIKKLTADFESATDDISRNAINDQLNDLTFPIAAALTEQGRAIQAASILTRATPEGMVRYLAKEINKYNSGIKDPAKKLSNLTADETSQIISRMREIQSLPDGREKAMKLNDLQNYIRDFIPTNTIDKVINVWKAGLLTGVKTSGLNIMSNIAHTASEIIKDVPAAAVDSVVSLFTGKRTKTFTLSSQFKGMREGFEKGINYWKTGFDERNIAQKLDYHRVNFGKGPVAKAFQTYSDIVFRTIGAQDQPFYYGAVARSIRDQALAAGKNSGLTGDALTKYVDDLIQNPTEEMIRYATLDAQTAVFQNKTKLGEAAKHLQKIPYVGQFIVPFAQTPSAVAMQIINYSPVGIVKTIIENIGKGKFDQRLFSQGLGRGIVGTAPLVIGAELYKNGMVQLDYPAGDERQIELDKETGRSYNAVLVDGEWRNVNTLGPVGNLVLIGAYFQKAFDSTGSPAEAMVQAGVGAINSLTDQTFMTGVNNFVNLVSDPEQYAKTYLPNLAASFIPTIVSDVARSTDPLERETSGDSFTSSFGTKASARIPGLRENLQPVVTAYGTQDPRAAGPIDTMINPTRPSESRSTELTDELDRLQNAGYKAAPTKIGDKNSYKESLTAVQRTQLYETVGSLVEEKLSKLVALPQYQQLSDEEKADQIEKFTEKAKVVGRAQYIVILTEGMDREERIAALKKYKADKLLTEQVFTEYQKLLSE